MNHNSKSEKGMFSSLMTFSFAQFNSIMAYNPVKIEYDDILQLFIDDESEESGLYR